MSFSTLFFGFAFGVFGVYFFKEGKKRANVLTMVLGIALAVFPYFVENIWIVLALGITISIAAFRALK